MLVPCVSCKAVFRLDSNITNPAGSLVRCPNCRFIFIAHPQEFNDQAKTQNTNIDQSILEDLINMQPAGSSELPLDEISENWNDFFSQGALSIDDFEEKVAKDSYPNTAGTDGTNLPDLSEYEEMIDWGDSADSDQPSATMT